MHTTVNRLVMVLAAVLAGMALLAAPSSATAPNAQASGTVTFTGTGSFTVNYSSCTGQLIKLGAVTPVSSFQNRPAPGCKITLVNNVGRFDLCVGRGTVPAPFRDASTAQIGPGSASACMV